MKEDRPDRMSASTQPGGERQGDRVAREDGVLVFAFRLAALLEQRLGEDVHEPGCVAAGGCRWFSGQ
jgi:hypothetical protein